MQGKKCVKEQETSCGGKMCEPWDLNVNRGGLVKHTCLELLWVFFFKVNKKIFKFISLGYVGFRGKTSSRSFCFQECDPFYIHRMIGKLSGWEILFWRGKKKSNQYNSGVAQINPKYFLNTQRKELGPYQDRKFSTYMRFLRISREMVSPGHPLLGIPHYLSLSPSFCPTSLQHGHCHSFIPSGAYM